MKRTFIAIDIPASAAIRECIDTFSTELKNEKIKWIEPDNLHLTLKFLGETNYTLLKSIDRALLQIAEMQTAFELKVHHTGVFKNLSHPTIIWLGVEPNPALISLHNAINLKKEKSGFIPDLRKFSPHLTIGRIKYLKENKKLQLLIQEFSNRIFQQFIADEIVFYESILSNEGPKYIPLGKYSLCQST